MANKQLIENILNAIGGADNILSATNCMTRMRVALKDDSKIDFDKLKNTDGVLGVVEAETLQIVLGPGTAKKVTDELLETYPITQGPDPEKDPTATNVNQSTSVDADWQDNKSTVKKGRQQGPVRRGLELIANIFIPMIPAIIAAGIFSGLATLIATLIGQETIGGNIWEGTRILFALIGNSFLGYFAIFTGVNAAKQFRATEALGGMVGAMSIAAPLIEMATLLGLYNVDQPLNSVLTTGKGGIIGVIIGVWVLAKVEHFVRKHTPDVLDLIVTPVVTLLIAALSMVFVIMPVSGFASDALVSFLNLFIGTTNPIIAVISGYVLSAVFLPMVLLGLHHGLIPIYAIQLENLGGVSLFPVLAMAGAGQVGAAIAIYLYARKRNNMRLQKIITGALPAGFLGVGEPLIYGVTLPLGKPFITAGLGAGFGGAYVMLMGVQATAWGPSGLVAIPLMFPDKMIHYFIGLVIAYIGGFVMTRLFMRPEDLEILD